MQVERLSRLKSKEFLSNEPATALPFVLRHLSFVLAQQREATTGCRPSVVLKKTLDSDISRNTAICKWTATPNAMSKNRRYPESKVAVNNNTKQAVDNSEVDDSATTPKPSADKRHAAATNETIDIQITKNITSNAVIIKKYVFDCSPVNYAMW